MPKQAKKVCYFLVTITPKTFYDHGCLKKLFREYATRWTFQLEKGEKEGKLHYGCHLYFLKATRNTAIAKWLKDRLPQESLVDVRPCASIMGSEFYCIKDDTRQAGPWSDHFIYKGQDLNEVSTSPHPWQAEVIKIVEAEPDDRTIMWIMNCVGNVGKSKLAKYLKYKKLAARIPLGTATQLKTNVIAKGAKRAYLVDLPRVQGTSEHERDLFSAIEEIKNGDVEAAMHGKCHELMMMPPHVICFSNAPPNYALASKDRWKCFHITDDLSLKSGWDPKFEKTKS